MLPSAWQLKGFAVNSTSSPQPRKVSAAFEGRLVGSLSANISLEDAYLDVSSFVRIAESLSQNPKIPECKEAWDRIEAWKQQFPELFAKLLETVNAPPQENQVLIFDAWEEIRHWVHEASDALRILQEMAEAGHPNFVDLNFALVRLTNLAGI